MNIRLHCLLANWQPYLTPIEYYYITMKNDRDHQIFASAARLAVGWHGHICMVMLAAEIMNDFIHKLKSHCTVSFDRHADM